jgi:hypothetical protein
MRSRAGLASTTALVAILAGCAAFGVGSAPTPTATDQDVASPVLIDEWTFSTDRRSITVMFTGGPEWDADDLCSIDYQGTAAIDGEELDISITGIRPHGSPPGGVACPALSMRRSLTLELTEPFKGNQLHDLAGQIFFLQRPAGLVEITGLPVGWLQRSSTSLKGSPTGSWQRVYSPLNIPGPEDRQVKLIQTFGAPAGVTGGQRQPDVSVNGEPATFYLSAPTGDMILDWELGSDGIALEGDLRDFTPEQFTALAESVVAGSDSASPSAGYAAGSPAGSSAGS